MINVDGRKKMTAPVEMNIVQISPVDVSEEEPNAGMIHWGRMGISLGVQFTKIS